jgi:(2S)-methylsuccinyl-CoA dehydrogenase
MNLNYEEMLTDADVVGAAFDELLAQGRLNLIARRNACASPADFYRVEQHAMHALAWTATYVAAWKQLLVYARTLNASGRDGASERLLVLIGLGEYLDQILGGIPMSQGEYARLRSLGLSEEQKRLAELPAAIRLMARGSTVEHRTELTQLLQQSEGNGEFADAGLEPEFEDIRQSMRRFAKAKVCAFAQGWHRNNDYIPAQVIAEMAQLGVFGLTIPESYGGMGLSKVAMCVVSEELSRAYLGVGSLGTRAEIAAELILNNGTEAQKVNLLARIASGEIWPTAVFTEPGSGSDLASLKTRANKVDGEYLLNGAKTWITHAARADLMVVLARTDPDSKGHSGISILLAPKTRGSDGNEFPDAGIAGSEIEVLGYRGLKEYELGFDGFAVNCSCLLGGVEGRGFAHLMQTFESARIQTAARAIGVAQSALDVALRYSQERSQFGRPLIEFPRISDKLVAIAMEINIVRQLSYAAARAKDSGQRCDLEAGMAKLLAARVAWSAADNALQVHGGNGFAAEYPVSRLLCDARVLSIFEGAAEIQAQIVARRILDTDG